ncbi:MAG: penicillin-binding protein, partial [Parafannyhessea umbonata]|nr:penicillin-binding protein [Parafannyhessea umbonata]
AITKIEDRNGNVVYKHKDKPKQVFSTAVADAAIDVMRGVTQAGGTASVISQTLKVDQPVAGKTGTTENARDLWYCGITPQLSVAVWCGYTTEGTVMVHGASGHPYNTTVPIYVDFINSALSGVARAEFPKADGTVTYKANSSWKFTATKYVSEETNQYRSYTNTQTTNTNGYTDTTNTTTPTNSTQNYGTNTTGTTTTTTTQETGAGAGAEGTGGTDAAAGGDAGDGTR